MNIYKDIKVNYHRDGFWVVDAWKTDDDDEEGKVIAVINDVTGDVYAIDQLDDLAKGAIDEKQTEIVSQQANILAEVYNHMGNYDKTEFLKKI
jgi:hypothetical protein